MLKHFKISTERDTLFPEFKCYQMDLSGPVRAAFEKNLVTDEDFLELPSWAKFAANPAKSKGFFARTLKALFLGEGNHDELNADIQTNYTRVEKKKRVSMMFLPSNIRKENIKVVEQIANETLPAYEIIVLSGAMNVTNRTAQRKVNEAIEKAQKDKKSVLIISALLAQRSFSIPEITELYLAYDRGETGSTIQKMSRVLTPDDVDKVGHIFSLSFDPNRDDKFDAMIIETALNYKKRNNVKSFQKALQEVLRTIDIYDCSPDGPQKVDITSYIDVVMQRKGISRVLGKIADLSKLSDADITALASGNVNYIRNELVKITESGKTKIALKKNTGKSRLTKAEIAKAREVIVTIIENVDVIIYGTGTRVLVDAMEIINKDDDLRKCVEEEFGVPVETITYLFTKQVISQDWVELIHDNA